MDQRRRRAIFDLIRWIATAGPTVAALTLPLPAARAAPIEFHYGGVITSADAGTGVTPGERFDGTFTYDPQTNPLAMVIENANFYTFGTSGNWPAAVPPDTSAMSLSIGDASMYSWQGSLGVGVSDVGINNPFNPNPHTGLNIHSYDINHHINVDIDLTNPNRGVFGSLAIPTAINLADFSTATVSVTGWGATPGTYLNYQGTIDTLTRVNLTTTPEPASVALWLGLGVAAWAVKARSRG